MLGKIFLGKLSGLVPAIVLSNDFFLPSLPVLPAECDKLRRDGCRSSQYYSQGPTFAASSSPCDDYPDEDAEADQKVRLTAARASALRPVAEEG